MAWEGIGIKEKARQRRAKSLMLLIKGWLRGQDLNLRPSGYEPDELPGCSTPRLFWGLGLGLWGFGRPGGDLLSRVLRRSTIGAEGFHGRVRDGIGCLAPRYSHQAVQSLFWGGCGRLCEPGVQGSEVSNQ